MSRLTYMLGVGITLVALAFLLTDHLLYPPGSIRLRDARRIRLGMTLAEVEAIFGRPADHGPGMCGDYHWRGIDNRAVVFIGFGEVFRMFCLDRDNVLLLELHLPREPVDRWPLTKLSDLLKANSDAGEEK
jgi:hypothetical protein